MEAREELNGHGRTSNFPVEQQLPAAVDGRKKASYGEGTRKARENGALGFKGFAGKDEGLRVRMDGYGNDGHKYNAQVVPSPRN